MGTRIFRLRPRGQKVEANWYWPTAEGVFEEVAAPAPPVFSVAPSIAGAAQIGVTLVASSGTISGGTVSQRQWQRAVTPGVWANIAGANATTYALGEADVDADIRVRIRATGPGGTTESFSAGIGPVTIPVPFTDVRPNGAQVTVTSPVDLSLLPARIGRAAFDATGTATTINETIRLTKRIRNVVPSQNTFTANLQATSRYICAADSTPGAVNNSTRVSPKPVVTWGMADRRLVANTINWEIIGFHWAARLARQLACVWVRATDGTNTTPWQVVNTVTKSNSCETPFQPECFAGALDITSLNDDSRITLQARAFPHFGVAASIADTTTETEWRFGNRFFYKNVARSAAPNIICFGPGGNDATGVVSTNEATAAATPCLTAGGAIQRAAALLGTATRNALSGLEVRALGGASMGTVGFVFVNQDAAAIKITRATTASRGSANITMSASLRPFNAGNNQSPQVSESALLFEDVTITRTADVEFQGEAARRMHVQFHNVAFNFSSATAFSGMKSNAHISIFGMTVSNYIGGLATVVSGDNRMLRGLSGSFNNTAIEGYCVIGCSLNAARVEYRQAQRGALIYNNFLPDAPGAGNATIYLTTAADGQDYGGLAVVQNLAPMLKTGAQINLRIAGDGDAGNLTHLVLHHNTTPGAGTNGRWNIDYDEAAVARSHAFVSDVGNLRPQVNTKGDIFAASIGIPNPELRIGNFDYHHGTECEGSFAEAVDAAGPPATLSFGQAYPGIGAVIGGGDTLFVDDRAVSLPGPVAGSVDGNYRLQAGSPARNLVNRHVLAFDFDGNPRRTSGLVDAGCYA